MNASERATLETSLLDDNLALMVSLSLSDGLVNYNTLRELFVSFDTTVCECIGLEVTASASCSMSMAPSHRERDHGRFQCLRFRGRLGTQSVHLEYERLVGTGTHKEPSWGTGPELGP